MIEELVSRSFAIRNAAHLAHWRAKGPGSFAKHEALGAFYDELIDKLDGIVEAYQGHSGQLIGVVKAEGQDTRREILPALEAECAWITDNREEICDNNPALENMLDEICGLYLSTIYKLKFLA